MNWGLFWAVFAAGIALTVFQGLLALIDGYFTQAQMHSHGVTNGWSFMEHLGMPGNAFIVAPAVAYAMSNYQLKYFSGWGLVVLLFAVAITLASTYVWRQGGIKTPEAHTHDDMTTLAGWVLVVFMSLSTWILGLVYFNLAASPVPVKDLVWISIALSVFFPLGVMKFNERWTFSPDAEWQVNAEIFIVWALTGWRLYP